MSNNIFNLQADLMKDSLSLSSSLCCVQLSVTLWTVACQVPVAMGFPRPTGVGSHFLLQGVFLDQGLNLCLLHWQAGFLPLSHLNKS